MFCMNCGKEIDDKAVICVHCGVSAKSLASTGDKNWTSALLLCLFLGGFGVHRFYTKHTGTAILQMALVFTVIGSPITAVWVLVDLINIICGNFKTANGEILVK